MGNVDSIPVVSQVKSLVQVIGGDEKGARDTQKNFLFNNKAPVFSQLSSAIHAIKGDNKRAKQLQEEFAAEMLYEVSALADSIPVVGHIKGAVHYAVGENEKGDTAMKNASRNVGVIAGGTAGFFGGGPAGAVAGGIAGGAAMDGIINGVEFAIYGDDARFTGYVSDVLDMYLASIGLKDYDFETGLMAALRPLMDGIGGLSGGKGTYKAFKTIVSNRKFVYKLKHGVADGSWDEMANLVDEQPNLVVKLDRPGLELEVTAREYFDMVKNKFQHRPYERLS